MRKTSLNKFQILVVQDLEDDHRPCPPVADVDKFFIRMNLDFGRKLKNK